MSIPQLPFLIHRSLRQSQYQPFQLLQKHTLRLANNFGMIKPKLRQSWFLTIKDSHQKPSKPADATAAKLPCDSSC